jgi:hypothetical protein
MSWYLLVEADPELAAFGQEYLLSRRVENK